MTATTRINFHESQLPFAADVYAAARAEKDYAEADRIRALLEAED